MGEISIPDSWVSATLPEACRMVMGQSPPSSTYNRDGNGLPFFQGKKEFGAIHPVVEVYCSDPNKIAENGAILLSVRAPVGSTNIAIAKSCIGRGLAGLHAYSGVEQMFLFYYLRAKEPELSGEGTGSTFTAVTKAFLEAYPIPLASTVEQTAIVEKLETLFSELDKGVELLTTIQQQLKRYRQAVLKAAFEGKLTADWRSQQTELPSADALLKQIQAERSERYTEQVAQWEQAVGEWEAAGGKDSDQKKPRKPTQPKDLPPMSEEELAELPELPDGWAWCRLEALGDITGGLTVNAKRNKLPLKLPYLRVANVYANELRLSEIKNIGVTEQERDKTLLADQDLLFVEGNGSASQIGRVALWDDSIFPCLHQNHLIRFRTTMTEVARYSMHWFLSPMGRRFIMRDASSTSGLHTLNITKVSSLAVPLAPLGEQEQILDEISSCISVIDELEKTVSAGLKQSKALRQSILKMAFEGRLLSEPERTAVHADPAYEPAEQLLERIKAEREQAKAAKPKRKTKAKAKKTQRKSKAVGVKK